ncbi:hypothetical protein Gotur_028564 [Gossypium turneri]
MDGFTFISNMQKYPLRLIAPTTAVSIPLLSCRNDLLIFTTVVVICAKFSGKGLFILALSARLSLLLMILFSLQTITNANHEHPWMLLSRQRSFVCDFCGTIGDCSHYICAICDLLVHKNYISLPRNILITRHHHVISHSYSLPQQDELCRICYEEVDTRYGSYHCYASDCDYIVHVHCTTNKAVWDGKSILEDYDERSMEALNESIK